MTDETIIEILRRDGYHCAANRLQELIDAGNNEAGFLKVLEEAAQKGQRYWEIRGCVPK